jgi:hypothetical protein
MKQDGTKSSIFIDPKYFVVEAIVEILRSESFLIFFSHAIAMVYFTSLAILINITLVVYQLNQDCFAVIDRLHNRNYFLPILNSNKVR